MTLVLTNPPEGFIEDPWPHYAAAREAGITAQPDGSVLLARYDELERIYRDTVRFSSDKRVVFAPKFGEGTPLFRHHTTSLVFNDPPLHTRVRRVMVGALTPRALGRLQPSLEALVDRLIDQMGSEADLIEDFAAAIPVEVIGNLLAIPNEMRADLRDWSLAILGALEPVPDEVQLARGHRAVREFSRLLEEVIADRTARPGNPDEDVLTRLIQAEGAALTGEELVQNCIFILNAGHETTTNLIGNALWLLNRWPKERARLVADPALITPAVDEVLRMESPNQLGNRLTTEDVHLHGIEVPAGTDVHLAIGAANRDADRFPDPDRFVADRPGNKHLAFGGGPHTCVGLTLARLEGRIALERFLARFPTYEVGGGSARSTRLRFRGFTRLPARLA
ncbi:MAG: cytochrome P450 [Pseudomonadota bacterium]